jgi:hypothetical protein
MNDPNKNRTRRVGGDFGVNTELEKFLDFNASEAYKRPWHKLERGLRLNRIRKFIEAESIRMNLTVEDKEQLTNLLHRALDKKLLNSKTNVIYEQTLEEIQEIKGLVYHKAANGKTISQIVEKKVGVTQRRKIKNDNQSVEAQTQNNPLV